MQTANAVREGARKREAYAEFLRRNPEYESTLALDELRAREFSRLDAEGHVYLDYTGSGLYGERQVRAHAESLLGAVLGNPHSANPASLRSTERLERCRQRVLAFFRAEPSQYALAFTANASHALKLVGESYPFEAGDLFLLTFDNHNSVNGIREFDRARGARTHYVPLAPPEMRVEEAVLDACLELAPDARHRLFAYPAQSNFSGVQHPLAWIAKARARGFDVLLDAAAFVATNPLDLRRDGPEFVALSFYKMFGFPTGVGALIARHEALGKLHRPWFAGGTIDVASVQADRFRLAPGPAGFEDGTPDFLNIPAVELGLDLLEEAGIDAVHARVRLLTGWLIEELLALRHGNGRPLLRLFGPAGTESRGGTLAFNFYTRAGQVVDHRLVERLAGQRNISLRTGCFCNPGAGELALGLSRAEIEGCLDRSPVRMTYDDFRHCIDPKAAGAVRISVGMASNFADAWAFVEFARSLLES